MLNAISNENGGAIMSNIGIVTLYGEFNYGNRLQNYAVNEIVRQLGFEPVNLICKDNFDISPIYAMKSWVYDLAFNRHRSYGRHKIFRNFTKKYMPDSKIVENGMRIDCEYVLCGSDQIWNPVWAGQAFYFAPFVSKEKRIAYVASFGVSQIPDNRTKEYTNNLCNMHAISVREEAGAKIVEDLVGIKPEVLIDPTMMLTKEEWKKISQKPRFYDGRKYALAYFLGDLTTEMKGYIEKVCQDHSLELICLENLNNNDYWYMTGPAEFIWLIQNCEIMFTDSFHGSVFSVLMEVPFLVWNKIEKGLSSSSRIDTLLTTLKLKNRRYGMHDDSSLFEKEYTHVEAILEEERRKSKEFLMRAMEIDK